MTIKKKPLAYYLSIIFAIVAFPFAISGLLALKVQWMNDTILSDILKTAGNSLMVLIEMYFIADVFKYDADYTIITTTEYKLFKCREVGKTEPFMMFADSIEELEVFFEHTEPDKKIVIEEAEMKGKSIEMKVFNIKKDDENSSIHS
jgi:hypothetical protein